MGLTSSGVITIGCCSGTDSPLLNGGSQFSVIRLVGAVLADNSVWFFRLHRYLNIVSLIAPWLLFVVFRYLPLQILITISIKFGLMINHDRH